uniref:Wntless GOLD domain-containing protein n=1 Tax=Oncorhynchus tshawytscha TaxID=74940 RepID=A0A8C8GKA9_ONCTS
LYVYILIPFLYLDLCVLGSCGIVRLHVRFAALPTMAIYYLATKCVDIHHPHQYHKICDFDKSLGKTIDVNNIVFALHVPLPNKQMSPWFQFLIINQIGK